MTDITEWSDRAREDLISGGRQLAEAVLVHIENLEKLRSEADQAAVEASTMELGRALDRFEDVQLDYCGEGLPYLDLTDLDVYDDEDEADEDDEAGADTYELAGTAESVRDISVISRIDLHVTDPEALRRAATEAGRDLGAGDPEHLGEALYNLTATGGIDQLMRAPGVRPIAAVTVFAEQTNPFTGAEIEEADVSEIFDLERAPVLFASSDVWDEDNAGPQADPRLN